VGAKRSKREKFSLIILIKSSKIKSVNLGDNAISDYGMHAIKNMLSN